MQQDNNIQNKLRELDEAQAPDLSNMDAHWQQMAAMLQPGAVAVRKGWPKWMMNTLSVITVVVLIGTALWYLSIIKKDGSDSSIAKQNSIVENEKVNTAAAAISSDTSSEETLVQTTPASNIQQVDESAGSADDLMDTAAGSVFDSLKINFTDCKTCPSKKADSAVISSSERKLMLQNLFAQLQKKQQLFTIDNRRDTLLQFEEGTVLLIPANSFGGINGVEIIAKEYYKTSDIILNQLNTASNKEQLVTGGMLQLKALYKGNEITIDKQKALKLFMPDSSSNMNGMQLFEGQQVGESNVNWVPQDQFFVKKRIGTELRVLNIIDQPYRIVETNKGSIGYFVIDEDSLKLQKDDLRILLKNKYGYYKVKFRSSTRDWFTLRPYAEDQFSHLYGTRIGDSVWMDQPTAERYKLVGTASRQIEQSSYAVMPVTLSYQPLNRSSINSYSGITLDTPSYGYKNYANDYNKILLGIRDKYSVDITRLGWINCDRFYSDSRKKIQYQVDLGDSATNYYTMLIFDNIKSMMTGFVNGNKVIFQNIPLGEPVKIISIGINKKGETVYSVTNTTTSTQELTGLQFESVSAPDLKTALSKMDK